MNCFFYKRSSLGYLLIVISIFMLAVSCSHDQETGNGYVITSPELAEIVYNLDGSSNIKGVTIECIYPKDLKTITRVGSFGKIDIEKIVNLNPRYVFITGLEQTSIKSELEKLGLETREFYIKSLDDMLNTIDELGELLNRENQADELIDSIDREIDLYKANMIDNKPSIYVEIYGNPLMSVADSSLVGELVEIAGADNIFDSLPRAYSRINPEDVINADPDVILLTYPGVNANSVKNRKGWDNIKACKNNRIYNVDNVDPDLILRATPRILGGLKALRSIIDE